MSFGDEHGYGSDPGRTDDDGFGGTGQTRTRLPDGRSGDLYGGGARRPARGGSRSLITVVGVVVLLIAAIAFANRSGDKPADAAKGSGLGGAVADPTAASGVKPVTGKNGTIPTGFAHDEQGAASAAANYAVALGSAEMFDAAARQEIIRATHDPTTLEDLLSEMGAAYSPAFYQNVGLNEDGSAPAGLTFVSRTIPVGTKVTELDSGTATVEVWSTGLLGLAGEGSTKPVTETWFTITQKLKWIEGDWKITSSSQSEGPTPVTGDNRASTADEIAEAVQGYGGFTYAR